MADVGTIFKSSRHIVVPTSSRPRAAHSRCPVLGRRAGTTSIHSTPFAVPSVFSSSHAAGSTGPKKPRRSQPVLCAAVISGADTAWMLTSSMFLLVTAFPGLSLFYGGLARVKSFAGTLHQQLLVASAVTLAWVAYGYSLTFSTQGMVEAELGVRSLVGTLGKAGLAGLSAGSVIDTIPEYLWVLFQGAFATLAPCIMLSGLVERLKTRAAVAVGLLWASAVYAPIAHSLWAGPGSFLGDLGTLDYAGGLVVHVAAGVSALVGALMLGSPDEAKGSYGYAAYRDTGNAATMVVIGSMLLWCSWMCAIGGSAMAADATAAFAMLNTQCCAASAAITWLALDRVYDHNPVTSLSLGLVTGLVAISSGAAFVNAHGAACIGFISVIIVRCIFESTREQFGKALYVFAVHGCGGLVGSILTAVFAHPNWGGNQTEMFLKTQVAVQLFSSFAVTLYAILATCLVFAIAHVLCGGLQASPSAPKLATTGEPSEAAKNVEHTNIYGF